MKHLTWITLFFTLSTFSQAPGNGVTDIDGNPYNSVIIGTQEFTKKNLNVSKYSDGTPIPQVTDATAWAALNTGAWCYYENTTANGTTYGKLYNWYAVAGIHDTDSTTPNKVLAPTGWHVPTDEEWTTLTTFLAGGVDQKDGGATVAGRKMQSTGTALWKWSNADATNSSGFTGLPGGWRDYRGDFYDDGSSMTNYGYWWASGEFGSFTTREELEIAINDTTLSQDTRDDAKGQLAQLNDRTYGCSYYLIDNAISRSTSGKSQGYSVRCIRD